MERPVASDYQEKRCRAHFPVLMGTSAGQHSLYGTIPAPQGDQDSGSGQRGYRYLRLC